MKETVQDVLNSMRSSAVVPHLFTASEIKEWADRIEAAMGVGDVSVIRIPATPGLDPITVYIDSPQEGAAAVTIRCYDSAWAACAWTAYWGSMGTDAIKFMASIDANYMVGSMLWPNAATASRRETDYARRVAQAVIDHCKALAAHQAKGE